MIRLRPVIWTAAFALAVILALVIATVVR